jgi:hypothetical protein
VVSSTIFKTGTGQNKPSSVCKLLETLKASAKFIKPFKGLKYPAPNMTALAAAAELTSKLGRVSASTSNCCALSTLTRRGFRLSEPWGLINEVLLKMINVIFTTKCMQGKYKLKKGEINFNRPIQN